MFDWVFPPPQIYSHYSKNLVPEFTLDRLHMIATTNCHKDFKAHWLQWWNSSPEVREANHFPVHVQSKPLGVWLNGASLWAHVTITIS